MKAIVLTLAAGGSRLGGSERGDCRERPHAVLDGDRYRPTADDRGLGGNKCDGHISFQPNRIGSRILRASPLGCPGHVSRRLRSSVRSRSGSAFDAHQETAQQSVRRGGDSACGMTTEQTVVAEAGRLKLRERLTKSTVIAFLRDREQAIVNVLALVILLITVLIRVPGASAKQWFSGAGGWANLAADLGVGYLAAWFFYYLVSWRPAYNTRQRVAVMVARQAFGAMAHASQLKGMLRGSSSSTSTGPMTYEELGSICNELHMLSPTTEVSITNPTVHASVIRAIWRYVDMTRTDVEPIIQVGALFDGDIVADAAALRSATIASISGIVAIEPALAAPGAPISHMKNDLWDFMDLAERLWLTVFNRYRAAAAAGPSIVADQTSGRAQVLAR
jgi:hypothetical protein